MIRNNHLFWIFFFLPISVTLFLVWFFFIPLPIADYWDVLHRGLHLTDATIWTQLQYAWEPFVDQKMVFPKLFIRYLAIATDNNHYWLEIIFGILGQFVVLLVIAYLIRKSPSITAEKKSALLLTSSWLLFWPNILVRFQHHWYSTQYTFVLVFAMLSIAACVHFRGTWTGVVLSLVPAVLSSISHGTGLIYLVCYMCAVIVLSEWSKMQKMTVFIGAFSVVLVIAVQIPPREVLNLPPLNWFTSKPIHELIFMFRCFGPDGVLRAQTGFLILVMGLCSCWVLLLKKKLFSGEYFAWILIFFWGGTVAFLSGITRSSVSNSPFRVYFYFFVVVLISVIVLTVIVYPKTSFSRRRIRWKFISLILAILYLVGCIDGIHDAAKIHKRNYSSREWLQFQPILVESDYRHLFPYGRFKTMLADLHDLGVLDDVDTRPFVQKADMQFTKKIQDGELYFVPSRNIVPGEVITFPKSDYSLLPALCFWNSGNGWNEEQSQELQTRLVNGYYWVVFLNKTVSGVGRPVKAIKLRMLDNTNQRHLGSLPSPTVWSR